MSRVASRPWLARALVAVLLVGAVAGCGVAAARRAGTGQRVEAGRGPAPVRRVVFAGDSITSGSRPQIEGAAAMNRYSPYVYAFPGLRSAQIDAVLEKAQSDHPGAYATVLNAGTNDVYFDAGHAWKRSYESLLARATTPCVVLTTVSERLDEQKHTPSASTINDYIRNAARSHPNYRIVDWNAEIRSGAPYVQPDGIHPNDAGRQWIAAQDVAALQSCGS